MTEVFPMRCRLGIRQLNIAYSMMLDEEGALTPRWWPVPPTPPHLKFDAVDIVMIQGLIVADYLARVRTQ